MYRVYEIFEVLPNGSKQRVNLVSGLESAKARLHEVANNTRNECYMADARTHQIVAQTNIPPAKWTAAKHIVQVCYDEQLSLQRAELLKSFGYGVISVIGNEAAKNILSSVQNYDMFVIDDTAPEGIRQEMALWLKAKYPRIKILALNRPNQQVFRADYNVQRNEVADWLAIISQEMRNCADSTGWSEASVSGTVRPRD